jgi:hypothetical protein
MEINMHNALFLFSGTEIISISGLDWSMSSHNELLVFFAVHTFAMLSTITNPILYGWLNTNLKHLFRAMIPTVRNERVLEETQDCSPEAETCHATGSRYIKNTTAVVLSDQLSIIIFEYMEFVANLARTTSFGRPIK